MLLAALVAIVAGVATWALRGRESQAPPGGSSLEALGVYGRVTTFTLTERSGRAVTLDDFRGLVWVANYMYTECTESCPTQTLQFAQLDRELPADAPLRLVSITVDPGHDTVAVLRRYAQEHGATERWWFLTGAEQEIYCLARAGMRLSVAPPGQGPIECRRAWQWGPPRAWANHGSGGITILHTARAVLIDGEGRIRAYHLATEPESMHRLRANLRRLLSEQRRR